MSPDDLSLLHPLADPRVSPDGSRAVYVVGSLDVAQDERSSRLDLVDLASGERRRLTAGPEDSSPLWSPDGSRIAFVRAGADAPGQLALIDPDGGEAQVVTAIPEGVTEPAWAPDGRTVVVRSRRWRDGDHDRSAEDRADRPRRITELGYRYDDKGWLHDRVARLFAVDVDEPVVDDGTTPLTPDDHDVGDHVVTTSGRVVFASARHDERETEPSRALWSVRLDGSGTDPAALDQLLPPRNIWGVVADHDDGVLLVGHDDSFDWPAPPRLHHLSADGELTDLAPDLDRDVVGAVALAGGDVLVQVEDRGSVVLLRIGRDGGEPARVVDGALTVTGYDATSDGRTVVYVATHPEDPGELWVRTGDDPHVLTHHNAALRERLLPVQHLTFERDGAEVDAWLLLPAGGDADVPLLLSIHGGPTAQYGHAFFDEFQVYAGAGYAVVGCNPRGSSGRGADWATAVVGAWGEEASVDVLDLEAAVDAALEASDRISRERLGIMGGSYGGYATARILSRSDRFRSAVVERGLLNWVSFSGTSDIGSYFDRMFLEQGLGDDASAHWASSPVRTAERISTPTLVVHSLEDYRCPVEQALQLFQGLRRAGVPSELVLFPDEGHELSRSGTPRHRHERFEIILDWHDRHLGVERDRDQQQ